MTTQRGADMPPAMQRIVSLLSSATEMLFALNLGDEVVAISHECDYPPESLKRPRATVSRIDPTASSRAIDHEVRRRINAGEPLYEVDLELLIQLRPDLIVTQSQCDVCAVRFDDVVAAVRSTPALAATQVVALNPQSLQDIFDDILRVGAAAGCRRRAEAYVASLRERVSAVQRRTQELAETQKPRVVCIEWVEPLMLAANWMPELLELAGAAPGLTVAGRHSRYHEWRQVVDYQPDAIVVMPCGFDLARVAVEATALADCSGWSDLPAVRQGRVYAVDANAYFNRPGPRLVDSLELLAHLLHPQRFPQVELPPELWPGQGFIYLTGGGE